MTWHNLINNKPKNFRGWDKAIKEAGLHTRHTEQLGEIYDMCINKIPRIEKMLAELNVKSDFEVVDADDGSYSVVDVSVEKQEDISGLERKLNKLKSTVLLCKAETKIRDKATFKRMGKPTPEKDIKVRARGRKLPVLDVVIPNVPKKITREIYG